MKAAILIPARTYVDPRLERAIHTSRIPWLPLYEHSDLPRVRSLLIEQGLEVGAERLILVDADTVPDPGVLEALANAEGVTPDCAVFGMYPLRQGERWSVTPLDAAAADQAIADGRSFPISLGGLGLCAIHRESLVRLGETLPTVVEEALRWRPFCVPFVTPPFGAQPARYYADDASLCKRLRDSGTELWCDPRLRAGHVVRTVLTAIRT